MERQLTFAPHGHILTNVGCWSADGEWIVYDIRPDAAGAVFEGTRIERVNTRTGKIEVLHESRDGARCGVVTCAPRGDGVVFIQGPAHPNRDGFTYAPDRRQGILRRGGRATNLDARDLVPPFTPGALRGGTHVHTFNGDCTRVAFTYDDFVLATREPSQRNVGVCVPGVPVAVSRTHARNHDGCAFSVLATRTVSRPKPDTEEISRAYEDAWIGPSGNALAFLGDVRTEHGTHTELFRVDLPDDLTQPGDGPLEGTETTLPSPPKGTIQSRLTFTADRKHPGILGPRHWPRSAPDGSRIAFLMRDDAGVVQLWTIAAGGGAPVPLTRNPFDVSSAFTWSADGGTIAHCMDGSVCATDANAGTTKRLTPVELGVPRPEACVFAPEGGRIAFIRTVAGHNQIHVVESD